MSTEAASAVTAAGPRDAEIATAALQALARAANIPETVTASVIDHRIILSGTAQWEHERQAAGRVVGCLPGVRAVINCITLRPTSVASELKASVGAALVQSAEAESSHVTVTRDAQGVVTLRGRVRSWAERRQAEQVCLEAPGVTGVQNRLEIEY